MSHQTLDDLVDDFINAANVPDLTPESAFAALLQALYDRRYTGKVLLNFQRGTPRSAEFPRPTVVRFTA